MPGRATSPGPLQGRDAGAFAFLPGSQWVAYGLESSRLYAVGSWTPGTSLGPGTPLDVTDDGRTILLLLSNRVLRLADVATGRTLGLLEDPAQENLPGTRDVRP